MGMYTKCRGFIEFKYGTIDTDKFNDLIGKAEYLSPELVFVFVLLLLI